MATDLIALIDAFAEAMSGKAQLADLAKIRDKLDSYIFGENVRSQLRRLNNPDEIGKIVDALRRLQRAAEALKHKRVNQRETLRVLGIGGGSALAVGSLVAMLSVATPAGLLIPLVLGGAIAGRSVVFGNETSDEIVLLEAIADRCKSLADSKDH
jgi:hypothetical protein